MKFCPKCKSIMVLKDGKWTCPRCGYSEESQQQNIFFTEKSKEFKEVTFVEEKPEVLPIDPDIVCPKCGHKGAYYWYMQTRASDEAETKFFRCPKCGYTWRVYE